MVPYPDPGFSQISLLAWQPQIIVRYSKTRFGQSPCSSRACFVPLRYFLSWQFVSCSYYYHMEDAVAAAWHMNQLKYEGEDITKEKLAGLSIVPLLEAEKSPTNRRITNIIDQFRTLTTLYFTPRSVYHFDAHLAQPVSTGYTPLRSRGAPPNVTAQAISSCQPTVF